MKKTTITEFGKLFMDLAKIIFAFAILAPLVKGGNFEVIVIMFASLSAISGIYLINKGV